MEQADTEVRIAKQDLYADIDEGDAGTIRRLVAVKGQQVPRAFAHLVDDQDVTNEVPVSDPVVDRATAVRRHAERAPERDHDDYRDAVAEVPGDETVAEAAADDEDAKSRRAPRRSKSRKGAANKARSSSEGESK